MLRLLEVVVMTLHLATIGGASLTPLLCIWLKRRQTRRQDDLAGEIGRRLASQSIRWLIIGTALGLLLVLMLWWTDNTSFFRAAAHVPHRRWWFGGVQILFSLACLVAYWRTWDRAAHRFWHPLLAALASMNLVYHFPPLFSAIAILERHAESAAVELSYSQFMSLQMQAEVLWRVAHFLLAALAVSGTMLLAQAARLLKQKAEKDAFRVAAWGARIALVAVVLEFVTGMALLLALPAAERARLIGTDLAATLCLGGGVLAAVGLLHHLGGIALGETSRAELLRAIGLLGLVLLLMVAARQMARQTSDRRVVQLAEMSIGLNQGDPDTWH